MALLDPAYSLDNLLWLLTRHDLSKLGGLLVVRHILEAKSHLRGIKKSGELLLLLSQLGCRTDEALLAAQLTKWRTADTHGGVLEMWIRNTLNDLLNVLLLLLSINVVLGLNQIAGLGQCLADLLKNALILKRIVDGVLIVVIAVIGGSGVAGVDGEELALNIWSESVDPLDTLDGRRAELSERSLVDNPLGKLLKCNIEAGIRILGWNDTVDGRVGEACALLDLVATRLWGVLDDELREGIGGVDGVLASDDGYWAVVITAGVDALCDGWCNKLQHIRADGAGNDICVLDSLDKLWLVGFRVNGTVVADTGLLLAVCANLDDLVRLVGVEEIDDLVLNICEDDLVSGVVEELKIGLAHE